LPAGPGALLGGWLGEHVGLRSTLAFSCACALGLAFFAWRNPTIRSITSLPTLDK
ncbi:MAG: MFS transporter, partial [Burkholderiales bacterium]|nr:MFS transporter [Burkholderiales bacterium]